VNKEDCQILDSDEETFLGFDQKFVGFEETQKDNVFVLGLIFYHLLNFCGLKNGQEKFDGLIHFDDNIWELQKHLEAHKDHQNEGLGIIDLLHEGKGDFQGWSAQMLRQMMELDSEKRITWDSIYANPILKNYWKINDFREAR
jgi:hypothetical protein